MPLLTNNYWSIWKILEKNSETSQEGPEVFQVPFQVSFLTHTNAECDIHIRDKILLS